MILLFSEKPGCREAHLERRYKNPLFPKQAQRVTQADINLARQADEAEAHNFHEEIRAILNQVSNLPAHVETEVILTIKEKLEQLYEICAGLPGELSRERDGLIQLNKLITNRIVDGAQNDPYALWQLQQEETAKNLHWNLLRKPLVAHLLRPDSPINADELVPTLLSEDEDSIRAVMATLDKDQCNLIKNQARQWLEQLKSAQVAIPAITWLRLQVLEDA